MSPEGDNGGGSLPCFQRSEVQHPLRRVDDHRPTIGIHALYDGFEERNEECPVWTPDFQKIRWPQLENLLNGPHQVSVWSNDLHSQELVVEDLPFLQTLDFIPGKEDVPPLKSLSVITAPDPL